MGCYWTISGEVIAKKGSVRKVVDVLGNLGMHIDKKDGKKISFSFDEYDSNGIQVALDYVLRPLVESGKFTAHSDEDDTTYCYRYGQKGPSYEKSVTLEYFPSEVDEFAKTLPKDLVDAVVRMYAAPAAK